MAGRSVGYQNGCMKTTASNPILHAHWALLPVSLVLGCLSADPTEGSPEAFNSSRLVASTQELLLEEALSTLDHDDVVISYREGSPTIQARVNTTRFSHLVEDLTVELQLVVMLPNGTTSTHDLIWGADEDHDLPSIDMPMVGLGRYEVAIAQIAIDGRVIEGTNARSRMHLRQHADALVGTGEATAATPGCGWGGSFDGNDNPNVRNGNGGNNTIHLKLSNDAGYGWGCDDTLWGGGGQDALWGGDGYDICYGGDGNDAFDSCEQAYQ